MVQYVSERGIERGSDGVRGASGKERGQRKRSLRGATETINPRQGQWGRENWTKTSSYCCTYDP